jgi:hypothetical protein
MNLPSIVQGAIGLFLFFLYQIFTFSLPGDWICGLPWSPAMKFSDKQGKEIEATW